VVALGDGRASIVLVGIGCHHTAHMVNLGTRIGADGAGESVPIAQQRARGRAATYCEHWALAMAEDRSSAPLTGAVYTCDEMRARVSCEMVYPECDSGRRGESPWAGRNGTPGGGSPLTFGPF
jgi:hypothetical protein